MKVKCIKSDRTGFTLDKLYEITDYRNDRFNIIDDINQSYKGCPMIGGLWEFELVQEFNSLKPEDLIKGKYYIANCDLSGEEVYIIKFDRYSSEVIFADYCILNDTNIQKNGGFKQCIREATKEEVLKHFPDEKFEDDIPEYVECIKQLGYTIIGKVYQARVKNGGIEWKYELFNSQYNKEIWDFGGGTSNNNWKEYFKSSNKTAFDLQNQSKEEFEYWTRQWPSGTLTMGCRNMNLFKSLETYDKEGGVNKNESYGVLENTNGYPQIKATKEQIDYFKIHGTLTTFSNKQESKSLVGRYIKITNDGYFSRAAKIGDYLKILKDYKGDPTNSCCEVEKYGVLGINLYTTNSYCKLMPEGFNPEQEYAVKVESKIYSKEEDFKLGVVYYASSKDYTYIFKLKSYDYGGNYSIFNNSRYDNNHGIITFKTSKGNKWNEIREAVFSEREWLNRCILANKFIPKEEALKVETKQPETMDKEELLKIAKEKYTIGTKFKCVNDSGIYEFDRFDDGGNNRWVCEDYIIVYVKEVKGCGKYLYKKDQWAEIISLPQSEKPFNFIKDRYYSCKYYSSDIWYFQVDRLEKDYLFVKGSRSSDSWNSHLKFEKWNYEDNSDFKEVTEQEAKGIKFEGELKLMTKSKLITVKAESGSTIKLINNKQKPIKI